ncbi:DASH complex subunit Spc34 [Drepanopeziza brunnea f. sp. 'multigermtubi' MB_m1]|uniref:DASH complex subunit SPC34 n=1 Tax=Marssonina brunnea f. sp. multigermtubi (strain MB_m1) TaxID=1072389 RepID=K1WFG4_MARBU|nr:DASH complex subunit Spc34 [Drepanopeziza brunnea f. sp. 'multigermtubi' MB_m1]EKD16160.1 DASH complex subunit Spc34 [Drepanopeziza brunnea f. sp. 'multigermtubi' MB_m1]
MSLLERHLEQISLSAESIAGLRFPPPKIFTNALLSAPDITSLIRDTEPHERALFSVPSQPPHITSSTPYQDPATSTASRRQTVFNVTQGEVTAGTATGSRAPRRNTAVAAVLGAELHNQVRKTEGKGEIDVEVLLRGAEKLNNVYSVPGVPGRIEDLRRRYEEAVRELNRYEERVKRQTRELERINRGDTPGDENEDGDEEDDGDYEGSGENEYEVEVTEEELMAEEEEIRELERKKKELEERVSGMERDLGGLSR